jgi:hypothetical protein
MSWRMQQLQGLAGKIPQDEALVSFILQHNVTCAEFDGESDIEYFQSRLPTCKIQPVHNTGLLAIFVNQLDNKLEQVLLTIGKKVQNARPEWVYIAINKYLITTEQSWYNLSDNYDQDLIDIVSQLLTSLNFSKIKQSYIKNDDGTHFNFVHPTTNMYYKKS